MEPRDRVGLYRRLAAYIQEDLKRERNRTSRRMLGVFLWCFVLPAVVSFSFLLLIRLGFLRSSSRSFLDVVILIFPVAYSIYFVGAEVFAAIPNLFRRGGAGVTLDQFVTQGTWRDRVCQDLAKHFQDVTVSEWNWLRLQLETDLRSLRHRTRYMTFLSGAVLYLLLQGVDSLTSEPARGLVNESVGVPLAFTTVGDLNQFLAMGLFLVLFYLSGSETSRILGRYYPCLLTLSEQTGPQPTLDSDTI